MIPPVPNRITSKLSGVMAGANADVGFITSDVINRMGNGDTLCLRRKIVVEHFNRFSGIKLAFTEQMAYLLFFLGVHADDRITLGFIGRFQFGNARELGITVYMPAGRLFFNALRFT